VETCGLQDAVARRVADQLIGDASRLTTGQLPARLRRLVIAADPQRAAHNAKEQVKGRRVVAQLTSEGRDYPTATEGRGRGVHPSPGQDLPGTALPATGPPA
jgi:hypothetical protein